MSGIIEIAQLNILKIPHTAGKEVPEAGFEPARP